MRLLVVSAHYPPDFTSGATLQAQRLAQAGAARGHEVLVYAGELDERRPPLAVRESRDAAVRVHWIATHPYLGWSDRRNFDNPQVCADFSSVLRAFGPDLVHFHALQTLGAGLVPAAKRAGAATVVTMHDFWWLCTRLFLVDRDHRPCSLVQAAGCCACEVDAPWAEERRAFLLRALSSADALLVPSRAAAEVLLANGLDPARLEVEENGLPPLPPPRRDPADDAGPESGHGSESSSPPGAGAPRPLRVLYLGGAHPLKGWDVLVAALRLLDGREALQVVAHGVSAAELDTPGSVLAREDAEHLGLVLGARFEPAELGSVLAAGEVLVLPSLMRETFSLATREALQGGLAVVCSDSLGPEEAVREGENGIVVPTGDPDALAHALRRLARDPGLVARLRGGARTTPVRAASAQLDSELARHERLVALGRGAGPGRRRPDLRRVLFVAGIDGAPLRYRAQLPVEALGLEGIAASVRHYRDPAVERDALDADVVVYYRVPATTETLVTIERLHSVGTPVLCDLDDLIFDPSVEREIPALSLLAGAERALWLQGVRRYRTTLEACDGFVSSTEPLGVHAASVTSLPVHRFDNGVGLVLAALSERARRDVGPPGAADGGVGRAGVRIAYSSGTSTHTHDWELVEPAVAAVLETHPEAELWLAGEIEPGPGLDDLRERVRVLPSMPWTALPWFLAQVDVNLAPLVLESRFNQAKSAIKWLEAALVETPTLASPTAPFAAAIDPGVNGLLAADRDEWAVSLDRLVADPELRRRLGTRARRDALLRWSPHLQGRRYVELLQVALLEGVLDRPGSSWLGEAPSEPRVGGSLTPYPDLGVVCGGTLDPDQALRACFDRPRGPGAGRGPAGRAATVAGSPTVEAPGGASSCDRTERARTAERVRTSARRAAGAATRLAGLADRALRSWEVAGARGVVSGAGRFARRQVAGRRSPRRASGT